MFSYMGSKSKLAALYPAPAYPTIIEPFAGSARYSLLHWRHSVKLYDVSPLIVDLWGYLMSVTEDEILELPDIPSKVNIDTFDLTPIQKTLIGFHLCRGKAKPRKVGHGQNGWSRDKERIASSLYKIRHWGIEQKDYRDIPNEEATWFIDPPYQRICTKGNGDRYPHSEIDYQELAEWTRSRKGQVIVCEGAGADWLPFKLLATTNGNTNNRSVKQNKEYLFMQNTTSHRSCHDAICNTSGKLPRYDHSELRCNCKPGNYEPDEFAAALRQLVNTIYHGSVHEYQAALAYANEVIAADNAYQTEGQRLADAEGK